MKAAEAGDPEAIEALRTLGERLGIGIANALNTFDPDEVVIGGGVSVAGELLLGPAVEVARRFALPGVGERTEIRLARHGREAGRSRRRPAGRAGAGRGRQTLRALARGGARVSVATAPANPFAQDVEQPLPDPTALVIFGAGGDLAARKLIPAVYNLSLAGLLPDHMRVLGVAPSPRRALVPKDAREAIEAHSRTGFDEEAWKALEPRLEILQGDFSNPELFQALAERLDRDDARLGPAQRVFYLAVAPRFFAPIAKALAAVGLGAGADPPTRLMIEKPFGHDLESALELNRQVASAFDESQVFRLDHYLGKETVQNLQVLRFANGILEPIWNRRYVDHVQITVAEDLGIGHRAAYYDSAGRASGRDPEPRHAAARPGGDGGAGALRRRHDPRREGEAPALGSPLQPEEVPDYVVRGQYGAGWVGGEEVPAYLDEEGVAADSRTDTYVAMRVEVDNWRWAGTPFYAPHRQAPAAPGDRDRGSLPARAAPALRERRHRRRGAERDWCSRCSRTREPRCAWWPRCPARR